MTANSRADEETSASCTTRSPGRGGCRAPRQPPPPAPWRPWPRTHEIEPPAFQIKASRDGLEFDLFLESTEDDDWLFRGDHGIRRPLRDLTVVSDSGLPVVVPEVQLLYMAKSSEPKNQLDFTSVRAHLDESSATSLATPPS